LVVGHDFVDKDFPDTSEITHKAFAGYRSIVDFYSMYHLFVYLKFNANVIVAIIDCVELYTKVIIIFQIPFFCVFHILFLGKILPPLRLTAQGRQHLPNTNTPVRGVSQCVEGC
jgi:hypothetical protein